VLLLLYSRIMLVQSALTILCLVALILKDYTGADGTSGIVSKCIFENICYVSQKNKQTNKQTRLRLTSP
jgi:hypothetical protein